MLYDLNTSDKIKLYITEVSYNSKVYEINVYIDDIRISSTCFKDLDLLDLLHRLRAAYPKSRVEILT